MSANIAELETRRAASKLGGGQKRIDAQHAKGRLTARERLDRVIHRVIADRRTGNPEGLPPPSAGTRSWASAGATSAAAIAIVTNPVPIRPLHTVRV